MNLTPGQAEAIEAVHTALWAAQALTPGVTAQSGNDVLWRDEFRRVLGQVAAAFPKETP